MKLFPIILFVLILQSCTDKKTEAASPTALQGNLQNNEEDFTSEKVVSLNFEELQKKNIFRIKQVRLM